MMDTRPDEIVGQHVGARSSKEGACTRNHESFVFVRKFWNESRPFCRPQLTGGFPGDWPHPDTHTPREPTKTLLYRGTSLTRKRTPLAPYSKPTHRALW